MPREERLQRCKWLLLNSGLWGQEGSLGCGVCHPHVSPTQFSGIALSLPGPAFTQQAGQGSTSSHRGCSAQAARGQPSRTEAPTRRNHRPTFCTATCGLPGVRGVEGGQGCQELHCSVLYFARGEVDTELGGGVRLSVSRDSTYQLPRHKHPQRAAENLVLPHRAPGTGHRDLGRGL